MELLISIIYVSCKNYNPLIIINYFTDLYITFLKEKRLIYIYYMAFELKKKSLKKELNKICKIAFKMTHVTKYVAR